MPTVTIDGLEVDYAMRGSGPALLMLAPGGFDATMEKWTTAGVWKGMRPLDTRTGRLRPNRLIAPSLSIRNVILL